VGGAGNQLNQMARLGWANSSKPAFMVHNFEILKFAQNARFN